MAVHFRIEREDLVTLMRLACDNSGQPFTKNETDFLQRIGRKYAINTGDGVEVPGDVAWGTERGTERY